MNRFLSKVARNVEPYTPGEQPKDMRYIKLNTNESPYGPGSAVLSTIKNYDTDKMRLYPSPDMLELKIAIAKRNNIEANQVFAANGSDEVLAMIFMAYTNPDKPVYFADITYGFYGVYSELFGTKTNIVPLSDDLSINSSDYNNLSGAIFIANPNAPTGLLLDKATIENIIINNPNAIVIIDEAYVDFADDASVISLINKFDNLIVVQTFSKSRGLAGARLGFAFANKEIIEGLERIKFSFNPYNINRVTEAIGIASLNDNLYFLETVQKIKTTRERIKAEMQKMGFFITNSKSNFLFAKHEKISGEDVYTKLRQNGILVRYFGKERIKDYVRITIGTDDEMNQLLTELKKVV